MSMDANATQFSPAKRAIIIGMDGASMKLVKNVIDWATGLGDLDENDNRVVQSVPLFLIDDECDYASIDTTRQVRDATGQIIDELDPTKTNLRIRTLLNGFSRKSQCFESVPYNLF